MLDRLHFYGIGALVFMDEIQVLTHRSLVSNPLVIVERKVLHVRFSFYYYLLLLILART